MTDMKHMEFLETVALSDVSVLRQKEETYQGSWKRAGGRSAWFMFRRNMDRLLSMMERPKDVHGFSLEDLDDAIASVVPAHGDCTLDVSIVQYLRDAYVSENVFAKIREHPDGADGTVLACLRDLRRYAVLIEAEMMARGVVSVIPGVASEQMPRFVVTTELLRDGISSVSKSITAGSVLYGRDMEIGAIDLPQPWFVTTKFMLEYGVKDWLYDEWHPMRRSLVPAIREAQRYDLLMLSTGADPLCKFYESVLALYGRVGDWWILRMADAPSAEREMWPTLQYEQNHKEWSDLESWKQALYDWIASETKYRVNGQHLAWSLTT